MKEIVPIQYVPDSPLIAVYLTVWVITDNLSTAAVFGWQLLTDQSELVDNGSVSCEGQEYQSWDGNRTFPYTFTADIIGVTLL
jgi:hypothetical protein